MNYWYLYDQSHERSYTSGNIGYWHPEIAEVDASLNGVNKLTSENFGTIIKSINNWTKDDWAILALRRGNVLWLGRIHNGGIDTITRRPNRYVLLFTKIQTANASKFSMDGFLSDPNWPLNSYDPVPFPAPDIPNKEYQLPPANEDSLSMYANSLAAECSKSENFDFVLYKNKSQIKENWVKQEYKPPSPPAHIHTNDGPEVSTPTEIKTQNTANETPRKDNPPVPNNQIPIANYLTLGLIAQIVLLLSLAITTPSTIIISTCTPAIIISIATIWAARKFITHRQDHQ